MATTATSVAAICAAAREASRVLARLDGETRAAALHAMADALEARSDEILEANARDMEAGVSGEIGGALLDRLKLTPERIAGIASDVRTIAALPDPVGETIEGHRLPNGLDVRKVLVPLGVVAVVYEARPNVTIDCSALCIKSGNAIVLRGSSIATHSNAVLASVARDAVVSAGLPEGTVSLVAGRGRGGVGAVATVPVIYAASGNCHVFVDSSADLDDATAIAVNAKVQRPGVCNAAETLLVHADVAGEFLPRVLPELRERGVELRVDARTR